MHLIAFSWFALLPAVLGQHIADHILNGLDSSYFDREDVSPIADTITVTSTSTSTIDLTTTLAIPSASALITASSAPTTTGLSVSLAHHAIDEVLGDVDKKGADVQLTCINCTTTGVLTASAAGFSNFSTNFTRDIDAL